MIKTKSLDKPDERRDFPHGHLETVELPGLNFSRATFQPGWRWSSDVKPLAGTDSCMFRHAGYVEHGHLRVRMDDGEETDLAPGDAAVIPPGHDAWVLGDEPCVIWDFSDEGAEYAKTKEG